jgi:hypothetical protein
VRALQPLLQTDAAATRFARRHERDIREDGCDID